jgi:hypothetical protein
MTNVQLRISLRTTARIVRERTRILQALEVGLPDGTTRAVVENARLRLRDAAQALRHEADALEDWDAIAEGTVPPPVNPRDDSAPPAPAPTEVHPVFAQLVRDYSPRGRR